MISSTCFQKRKIKFFKNFFIRFYETKDFLILKISEEKSVCYFVSYFISVIVVIFATKNPVLSSAFSNFKNAEPDVKLKSSN